MAISTAKYVSIHARARRATLWRQPLVVIGSVSIHARARRATGTTYKRGNLNLFQFTPAHDGRPTAKEALAMITSFQFTPAHDGRPWPRCACIQSTGFNSRPRTTGDVVEHVTVHETVVSIHARARRATRHLGQETYGIRFNSRPRTTGDGLTAAIPPAFSLFQFTPAHDGRQKRARCAKCSASFNSRPRTTGDRTALGGVPIFVVSIHARARRATA